MVGSMQSWLLHESPGSYRYGEVDLPDHGPGEVWVRVVASALNVTCHPDGTTPLPEGWDRLAVLTNRPAPMVPEDTMVVKWLVRAAPGGSRVEGCWAARAGGRTRPR